MIKLTLAILLLLSVVGCSGEVKRDIIEQANVCVNGHLYFVRNYGITPLFDYRTDTPTLIRCEKRNGRIEYEEEKIR